RHRLASALRFGDPLPARTDSTRGWAEPAVEFSRAIDRPDNRVEGNGLEPQAPLAPVAECLRYLLERKDQIDVVLAPEAHRQPRQQLAPAGATEVGLGVLGGKTGVHRASVLAPRA